MVVWSDSCSASRQRLPDLEVGVTRMLHHSASPSEAYRVLCAFGGLPAQLGLPPPDQRRQQQQDEAAGVEEHGKQGPRSPLLRELVDQATDPDVEEAAAAMLRGLSREAAEQDDPINLFADTSDYPEVRDTAAGPQDCCVFHDTLCSIWAPSCCSRCFRKAFGFLFAERVSQRAPLDPPLQVFQCHEEVKAAEDHLIALLGDIRKTLRRPTLNYTEIQNQVRSPLPSPQGSARKSPLRKCPRTSPYSFTSLGRVLTVVHPLQGKYLVEVPVDSVVPSDWVKVCGTKKVDRYWPPAVKDGIFKREQAIERRRAVCKVVAAALLCLTCCAAQRDTYRSPEDNAL